MGKVEGFEDALKGRFTKRAQEARNEAKKTRKGKKRKQRDESDASAEPSPLLHSTAGSQPSTTQAMGSQPSGSSSPALPMDRQTKIERMINLQPVPNSPIAEEVVEIKFPAEATLISKTTEFIPVLKNLILPNDRQ